MKEAITVHWIFVKERSVFVLGFLNRDNQILGFEEFDRKPEETLLRAYERMCAFAKHWCTARNFEAIGLEQPMNIIRLNCVMA